MNNKQRILVMVGVFLSTVGIAHGQSQIIAGSGQATGNQQPLLTAEHKARLAEYKARLDQQGLLDQAARDNLKSGNYADAEVDARASFSLGAASSWGGELLAAALYAQGKDAEALQVYKKIADTGEVFPRNLVPYAMLLMKSGKLTEAATVYNQALPQISAASLLRSSQPFSLNTVSPQELEANIHILQGLVGGQWGIQASCEDPMTQFTDALRLMPDSPAANYYYGYGWQDLTPAKRAILAAKPGQRDAVKAALEKAATLGTGDVQTQAKAELKQLR